MDGKRAEEMERILAGPKSWKYSGEVRACGRKHDSLLNEEIEFDAAMFNIPVSKEENNELTKYIIQRFREKTFDNFDFKEDKPAIQEEVYDTSALESSKEIIKLYEGIEQALKSITDYGNSGF